MKDVVFESGGKQYKASEGVTVQVDKLKTEVGNDFTFDKVLLYTNDGTVEIGQPYLPHVQVIGKVLEQKKGEKIRVAKFKAKARYRRVTGFRAQLTTVVIEKIAGQAKKIEKSAEKSEEKTISSKSTVKAE